jgi:glycogen synthase
MKVLYAVSEALPFIASGGLADVAGSLPRALKKRRVDCRVILPLYGSINAKARAGMRFITDITVPVAWRRQYCGILKPKRRRYLLIQVTSINLNATVCTDTTTTENGSPFFRAPCLKCSRIWILSRTSSTATIGKRH